MQKHMSYAYSAFGIKINYFCWRDTISATTLTDAFKYSQYKLQVNYYFFFLV